VPGAAPIHSRPDMRGTQAREDGLVVRVKVTIDLRSRHSTKRMPCRGYGILLLVALEGPWVPAAALHLTPGPDTAGHAGEKLMVGCNKVTIDLRSRHSTKRMHAAGAMESFY
jgi:hypothetical protein